MKRYFISASGTGAGKTLVTCALVHQLRRKGEKLRALKPVISGFDSADAANSDTGMLLSASGAALTPENMDAVSPWRFRAPLSPDMAAEDEGRAIDFDRLVAFSSPREKEEYLLVEGVGGILVPLDERHTVLDWAQALGFPVILVTGSALGTLSHTLAAARAVLSKGLPLHALVISESADTTIPLIRTAASLRRFLPRGTNLISIGRLDSHDKLWEYVPDLSSLWRT